MQDVTHTVAGARMDASARLRAESFVTCHEECELHRPWEHAHNYEGRLSAVRHATNLAELRPGCPLKFARPSKNREFEVGPSSSRRKENDVDTTPRAMADALAQLLGVSREIITHRGVHSHTAPWLPRLCRLGR